MACWMTPIEFNRELSMMSGEGFYYQRFGKPFGIWKTAVWKTKTKLCCYGQPVIAHRKWIEHFHLSVPLTRSHNCHKSLLHLIKGLMIANTGYYSRIKNAVELSSPSGGSFITNWSWAPLIDHTKVPPKFLYGYMKQWILKLLAWRAKLFSFFSILANLKRLKS